MTLPTPHFEKLVATLANEKLPEIDKPRLESAIARYHEWIGKLDAAVSSAAEPVDELVRLLNEYRNFIDLELVFDLLNVADESIDDRATGTAGLGGRRE